VNGKFIKKGFLIVKDEAVAGQPIKIRKGRNPRRSAMRKSRSLLMIVLMGGAILLGACSSATVSKEPLSEGELRLLNATLPVVGVVKIGLPYDVTVTFIADGEPRIRRACFSWSGEGPYCYTIKPQDVTYGSPGDFRVTLFPAFIGPYRAECYVEYYQGTKILRTNVVTYYVDVMM
jgi:energy-converting hydrogenase Eha subunit E